MKNKQIPSHFAMFFAFVLVVVVATCIQFGSAFSFQDVIQLGLQAQRDQQHNTASYTNIYNDDLNIHHTSYNGQPTSSQQQPQDDNNNLQHIISEKTLEVQQYLSRLRLSRPIADITAECQGELQCWLKALRFTIPDIAFDVAGVDINLGNFTCGEVDLAHLQSGSSPSPTPHPDEFGEIHMTVQDAGLNCNGTLHYNVTFLPGVADFVDFQVMVQNTTLGLQLYILSDNGQKATGTRQGECSIHTDIDMHFEGSMSAFVLELIRQPLINAIKGLIEDNFCLITRDVINITLTDMITELNKALLPTLAPYQPLGPVSEDAKRNSIPFASMSLFKFLDQFFNGDGTPGSGLLSDPRPMNCLVNVITNNTGNFTLNLWNATNPPEDIIIPVGGLGNITVGLSSLTLANLNTFKSLLVLHPPPGSDFEVDNVFKMERMRIYPNVTLAVALAGEQPEQQKLSIPIPILHESFQLAVDMLQPEVTISARPVIDKSRLSKIKLGSFCKYNNIGLLPCLLSLFDGTWEGNGGLQFANLALHSSFTLGVLPNPPNDSPLEKDIDNFLNTITMLISQKFGTYFTNVIHGLGDNVLRLGINSLLRAVSPLMREFCDLLAIDLGLAVDVIEKDPFAAFILSYQNHQNAALQTGDDEELLIWSRTVVVKLVQFLIHDVLHGYEGMNSFLKCAVNGGPDHDFDTITTLTPPEAIAEWHKKFDLFNETYGNATTKPFVDMFNSTIRGLDSWYQLEFLQPVAPNATHTNNTYRLRGEFGFGDSGNYSLINNDNYGNGAMLYNEQTPTTTTTYKNKYGTGWVGFLKAITDIEKITANDNDGDNNNTRFHDMVGLVLDEYFHTKPTTTTKKTKISPTTLSTTTTTDDDVSLLNQKDDHAAFVANMLESREKLLKFVDTLQRLTETATQHFNDINFDTLLPSSDTQQQQPIIEPHDLTFDELQTLLNMLDSTPEVQDGEEKLNELFKTFTNALSSLMLTAPNATQTTITTYDNNNNDLDNDNTLQQITWGVLNNEEEEEEDQTPTMTTSLTEPQGPFKIWISMGVPIASRFIVLNTTVIINSFDAEGEMFLSVSKPALYDLTLSQVFSLCLPSVFRGFNFEQFHGHVHSLTLILDMMMDDRAKLVHAVGKGDEFVGKVNNILGQEAFGVLHNVTAFVYERLLWASDYACRGVPLPAPHIKDNLKHSSVEWAALFVPSILGGLFVLYSFVLLSAPNGTKRWASVFCRTGKGSQLGHMLLADSKTNDMAAKTEKGGNDNDKNGGGDNNMNGIVTTNINGGGGNGGGNNNNNNSDNMMFNNSVFDTSDNNQGIIPNNNNNNTFDKNNQSANPKLFSTKTALMTTADLLTETSTQYSTNKQQQQQKLKQNNSINDDVTSQWNLSLSLRSRQTGFVEEYDPFSLPEKCLYGTIHPNTAADVQNNNNNTTTSQQNQQLTYQAPNLFSNNNINNEKNLQQQEDPKLVNLNTLALQSGVSLDLLTGSAMINSPTLPFLFRIAILCGILFNIMMFVVSNMSNGAAVTLIVSLFDMKLDLGTIFNFTLISTIEDMWKAKVYVLFVLIGAFSGFLPYFKLVLMLACWTLPQKLLTPAWRHFILIWLDRLGKWSLIDAFVFVLMFVAFRMHLPVFGDYVVADSIVRSDPGFYYFLLATMMSLFLSHTILALHRHTMTPYVVESGGPKRSVHQHYHTLFIIDQHGQYYGQAQQRLLNSLPPCEEGRELIAERTKQRKAHQKNYYKSLEKLGYTPNDYVDMNNPLSLNAGINSYSLNPLQRVNNNGVDDDEDEQYDADLSSTSTSIGRRGGNNTITEDDDDEGDYDSSVETSRNNNPSNMLSNVSFTTQMTTTTDYEDSGLSDGHYSNQKKRNLKQSKSQIYANNKITQLTQNNGQVAVKLQITPFGSVLMVLIIVFTVFALLYGCFIDTFEFTLGGISGWLLGPELATNAYSVWSVGVNLPDSSRDPTSIGIHWIQFTYFIFALAMPLIFMALSVVIYIAPFTLKHHKALHIISEIAFAWSGTDVFIVSVLAAVLQISQLAVSLVGDKCDFLIPFMKDYMYESLNHQAKCFMVVAQYKDGAIYLMISAILYQIVGVLLMALSSSAMADRTDKYHRLIQYALFRKQIKQQSTNQNSVGYLLGGSNNNTTQQLIKQQKDNNNNDEDQYNLTTSAQKTTTLNNDTKKEQLLSSTPQQQSTTKNTTVVEVTKINQDDPYVTHVIREIQNVQNTHPIKYIPPWYPIVQFLALLRIVSVSRQDVVPDIFLSSSKQQQQLKATKA